MSPLISEQAWKQLRILPVLWCLVWGPAALEARSASPAERVRELNGELLRKHAELQQAAFSPIAPALRVEAGQIIARRAEALSALIELDPAQALSLVFSEDLLAALAAAFPQGAAQLESHGSWQGPVETWVEDDLAAKQSRTIHRIRIGSESLELTFARPAPAGFKSGELLRIAGIRASGRLVAAKATIIPAAKAASSEPAVAAAACTTTGVQNTAVLLVTFPGVTPPSTVTPQSVYDIFFGASGHSLTGYWDEASYGATSAAGNVFGWYTLSTAYTCSTMGQALSEAMNIASAAGANFQNYTRVFLIYPNVGCVAGFAQVGCSTLSTPSGSIPGSIAYIESNYLVGDQGVQLAVHEGGHNLGLQHAGTLAFGTDALGPLGTAGTVSEFGDDFSAMGSQTLGLYSAPHKAEILGWLAGGSNYQVVQSSGVWTLQPLETSPAGLDALKIQRGAGNNDWLWVEYRQPIGTYDSTVYFQQPSGGAFIHYEDLTTYPDNRFTHLIDLTPGDGSWYNPALVAGQAWTDPYTNLSLTVSSATSTALTLMVNYGVTPCTHANPIVSASPLDPSAYPGHSVGYNVSVTNNDSAGCSASTFSLSSSQPSGWSSALSANSLTLSPGQSGSVTLTKTAPAGAGPATYAVNASAASGSYAGSGAANCTVMANPLAVSLSVAGSTYTARQTVSISATVSYSGAPVSGAAVTFTMTKANGSTVANTSKTNSKGTASWSYKVGANDPVGTYTVSAQAVYGSFAATSNTASFTVQ